MRLRPRFGTSSPARGARGRRAGSLSFGVGWWVWVHPTEPSAECAVRLLLGHLASVAPVYRPAAPPPARPHRVLSVIAKRHGERHAEAEKRHGGVIAVSQFGNSWRVTPPVYVRAQVARSPHGGRARNERRERPKVVLWCNVAVSGWWCADSPACPGQVRY